MTRFPSARWPAAMVLASASKRSRPDRASAATDPAAALPLHDHSCPRREVAVLGEVDSGFRWDEA